MSTYVRSVMEKLAHPRTGKKTAFQVGMAANLVILGVGLPLTWNFVAKDKYIAWKAARERKANAWDAESEQLAIQILVNERRAARGLPPYPYDAPALTEDAEQLFAAAAAAHKNLKEQQMNNTAPVTLPTRIVPVYPIYHTHQELVGGQSPLSPDAACCDEESATCATSAK